MEISLKNSRPPFSAGVAALLVAALPLAAQSPDLLKQIAHPPLQHNVTRDAADAATLGYGPVSLRAAYSIGDIGVPDQGSGQTIALVDAYGDPTAEADLATFSTKFGLPPCATANGCFKLVYAGGAEPPADTSGWSNETAIDTQWARCV